MTSASAAAGRWGSDGRLAFLHDAKAAADDSPHGLSGFRMLGERLIRHALLELKDARLAGGVGWDGFVNVGGHGCVWDF